MTAVVVLPNMVTATTFHLASGFGKPCPCSSMPFECGGDVVEDGAGDRIEAQDIDHRMNDHHVLGTDQGFKKMVAGGDGRDEYLGHADRQTIIAAAPITAPSAPPMLTMASNLPSVYRNCKGQAS